jgi:hypothetical protein
MGSSFARVWNLQVPEEPSIVQQVAAQRLSDMAG